MGDHDLETSSTPITPRPNTSVTPTPRTSAPVTPRPMSVAQSPYITSAPHSQFHSPSLSRSPLLSTPDHPVPSKTPPAIRTPIPKTPNWSRNITPRFLTPLGSPIRKILHLTKIDPHDAWLPITESRNGNVYYAAFHTLCSGIGIQALVLPVAYTVLGWAWGTVLFCIAFIWQLYTLYLLVQLHEDLDKGVRYSRYMQLAAATFGDRLSKFITIVPLANLSIGTCTALVIIGGTTCKTLFKVLCGPTCTTKSLSPTLWYLVFTNAAALISQLPNLNSIAGVSLIGAITAVGYCTSMWIVSVAEGRVPQVSYDPVLSGSEMKKIFTILNAVGIIAFAFRGHNLVLEIQATMPSDEKHPSRVPMWKGVKVSYTLIAMCLFPLAIGGYWAYGQLIPTNGGMLTAMYQFHGTDTSRVLLAFIAIFVIINALSSFQIYAMPMFDELESVYVTRYKRPCPWWLRVFLRFFFAYNAFFPAVAFPFIGSFAGLLGSASLPVTLAYPCFMWLKMKKPKKFSPTWWLNWGLGIFGTSLSVLLVVASIYIVIDTGVEYHFFKPT